MTASSTAPLVLPGATLAEAFGIPRAPRTTTPRLSPRQTTALHLVAEGVPYQQIAAFDERLPEWVKRLDKSKGT